MNQVAILILTYLIFPKLVEQLFRFFRELIIYFIFIYITFAFIMSSFSFLQIFIKIGLDYIYGNK